MPYVPFFPPPNSICLDFASVGLALTCLDLEPGYVSFPLRFKENILCRFSFLSSLILNPPPSNPFQYQRPFLVACSSIAATVAAAQILYNLLPFFFFHVGLQKSYMIYVTPLSTKDFGNFLLNAIKKIRLTCAQTFDF